MPESRLNRARATLPSGYQFGDGISRWCRSCGKRGHARCNVREIEALSFERLNPTPLRWRPLHENAAERLQWNTIEPD